MGEGVVRKPLSEGRDGSQIKQAAYEPTVGEDRRGRLMTSVEEGDSV